MSRTLHAGLLLLAALAGAGTLLLGGCGSSGKPAGAGGATTTSTTAAGGATTTSTPGTGGAACVSCFATPDCPAAPACVKTVCEDQCCKTLDLPAESGCSGDGGNFCDGHGKCVACVSTADCPITGTACATATCTGNACVTTSAVPGTACSENGGKACDGKGHCAACAAASDCPATGTTCATAVCGAANLCDTTRAAKGTSCSDHGGTSCDGNGHCAPASCVDDTRDGDETDVDCGGSCPSPCAGGKGCSTGADCLDKLCGTGTPRVCLAPTCTDGVQNGAETDVDCGGPCPRCADTRHCGVNADCSAGHCFGFGPGTCVSCADGVKDGNETDVDCGGADCDLVGTTCGTGKSCSVTADCATLY